jgi:hypothetical protein
MAASSDLWYIRFPNGRILRARSTEALRRNLKSGRIPWDSRVRRSAEEPWQTLGHRPEFADIASADNAGAEGFPVSDAVARDKTRSATGGLPTLGVRGHVAELFIAFDSSVQRTKLITAAITGLVLGVTLGIGHVAIPLLPRDWAWAGYLGTALVLLILFNICTSILTQMTAIELSRYRRARFSEVRAGLFAYAARLTCAVGLVGGPILGLIFLVRFLPGWLTSTEAGPPGPGLETVLHVVNGVRLFLETVCLPILGFAVLLMGPIFIVEDYSIWRGLREWIGMLQQHLGRIYVYQALAFAFAVVMTVPLMVPVLLALGFAGGNLRTLSLGELVTFYLLIGIALTPTLTFLLVAHVFIYLNLRYEFFYSARER